MDEVQVDVEQIGLAVGRRATRWWSQTFSLRVWWHGGHSDLLSHICETVVSPRGTHCKRRRRPRQGGRRARQPGERTAIAGRARRGDRPAAGHGAPARGRARGPRPRAARRRRPVRARLAPRRPRAGRRSTAIPARRAARARARLRCATPPGRACSSTSATATPGVHRLARVAARPAHDRRGRGVAAARRRVGRQGAAAVDARRPTRGWVESVEEREAGVASVSAPVRDRRGDVIAAISVSGPIERTTRKPGARYGEAVCRAAAMVSSI